MKQRLTILGVGLLVSTAALSAQSTTAKPPDTAAAGQEVHLVGCLELETDYRARVDAGKGGVLGTGLGAGNEYVLSAASTVPPGTTTPRPMGTSGSSGTDYLLTGSNEPNMKREIGRQVHIIGTLDRASGSGELSRVTVKAFHPMKDYCPATPKER